MLSNQKKFIEKRKGPDIWVKFISWSSIAGWIILFCILTLITKAKPQVENFFDKMLKVSLRRTWDMELAQYAFYLMIFLLAFSVSGLIVNIKRSKRKSDRFSLSIILMIIFSITGIILYTVLM